MHEQLAPSPILPSHYASLPRHIFERGEHQLSSGHFIADLFELE